MLTLNTNQYNIYKYTAFLSIAVIFLFGVAFLQPTTFSDNANAEDTSASTTVDTSVTVEPVIEIWTTDTNNDPVDAANITTDPDGSIASTTVRAHVSTSNVSGYTLTIQSGSDDAKMVHADSSITSTINPLTGNGTSTNSWKINKNLNNMWGYSIGDNDSYLGVPGSTTSTTIDSTDAANNDNYTDVTFAAKADTSLPAGTYTDTAIFSAVANPQTTPITDGMYMQDVTTQMCADSTEWTSENNQEYTLKDSRDNLEYKIRKLADGHCWMAQNLRLTADTLSANSSRTANPKTTLTSDDTDINGSTASFAMPSNASWSSSSASSPTLKGAADATKLPVGSSSGSAASGDTAVARGAYYSWCTATVDCTADPGTGKQQPSSICPKGWHLANSDGSSDVDKNQYQAIYNAYGATTSFNQAFNTFYSKKSATYYLAGYWNAYSSYQYVRDAGAYGYWWSSTSQSSNANNAWRLNASTSSVAPADGNNRYHGISVRCMLNS